MPMARNIWRNPKHLLTLRLWHGQRSVRKTLPKIYKRFPKASGEAMSAQAVVKTCAAIRGEPSLPRDALALTASL